jgi:hypothetical protein
VQLHLKYRLAVPAVIVLLGLSSCGSDGGGGSDQPADNPEIVTQVSKKIEAAAAKIANSTKDKHLPPPYEFKVVCLDAQTAAKSGTPNTSVQCHIEAFTRATAKRPNQAYVWSEDWRVPVDNGTLGEPEIVGDYRIRNFLRKDNRLNCSGGKTPQERCTGIYVPPADQGAVPGQPPASGGQQEVPINP